MFRGTVPTVVACNMSSNGTKLYYGPVEHIQTLLFIHLNGRFLCSNLPVKYLNFKVDLKQTASP